MSRLERKSRKIIISIFVLFIVTPVYGTNHVDPLVREARIKASDGDLEGATALYHQALQIDGGNTEIRRELAQVLVEANVRSPETDQVEVLEIIDMETQKAVFPSVRFSLSFLSNGALTSSDECMNNDVLLILEKLQNNDNGSAIKIAQTLQEKYPEHPVPYNLLGLAWEGQGNPTKAQAFFQKALTLSQNFHAARLNLAELESHLGEFPLAHQEVDQVLKTESDNRRACLMKAQLYTLQGQLELAQQWSAKVSENL